MVKGIDNQVMIHRTAEYARQLAARNDHAENAKAFAAQLEQQRAVHGGQSVGQAEKVERKTVSPEKDGKSPKDEEEKKGESAQDETKEDEKETSGPDTLGKEIDITV